jgi:GNAT superfamily N-acetyltransferase
VTGLLIRRAVASDAAALTVLNEYGLRAAGIKPEDDIYAGEDADGLSQTYEAASGGCLLVGEIDQKVAAMGALRRIDRTTAELLRMRVAPEHQGKGYATAVLQALESEAARMGYGQITLITGAAQHPAVDLYTRHGYEPIERLELLGIASVRMAKRLHAPK